MDLYSDQASLEKSCDSRYFCLFGKVYLRTSVSLIFLLIFITASLKIFMAPNHGHNYLFIAYGLFFIIINRNDLTHFYKEHIGLYLFFAFFVISTFLHVGTFRFSSFIYTIFYLLIFHLFISVIRNGTFGIYSYIKVIQGLLMAFFIVLVIQQIMHLFGINPVFNQLGAQGWKLNSLSLEPSLTGSLVNVLFYSFVKMKEFIYKKELTFKMLFKDDFWTIFPYLYVVFTCGSSFGVLFFIIIFFHFLKLRPKNIILISFFCLLLGSFLYYINFVPMMRIFNMISAIFTFDQSVILQTELSGGVRIIPIFQYVYNFSFFDINIWLGHGMTYSSVQFAAFLNSDQDMVYGWCFPNFAIDHGLICFALMMYFVAKNALFSFFRLETVIFIILLLNMSLNTTSFWAVILYFTLNKFFITNFKHTQTDTDDNSNNSNLQCSVKYSKND